MSEEQKYENIDGVTKIITNTGIPLTFLNIYDALKDKNPRNVFLNGQLYIEDRLDRLISGYFGCDNNIRQSSILNFLKSRYCDFDSKIEWLFMLIGRDEVNSKGERKITMFVENKDIKSSLRAIGAVRNAFQHNLDQWEALIVATKNSNIFKLTGVRPDSCKNINDW